MVYLILLIIPIIPIIFRKEQKIIRLKQKQNNIKVYAVIPAHNEEKVIESIISDCINNKFNHIYIILDACNDNTEKIIRNSFFLSKDLITIIKVNEHNKGKAIRKALKRILIGKKDNDIIAFFDADNRLDNNFVDNIIVNKIIVQTRIYNKNFTNSISNYYAFIMDYASRIQKFLNLIGLSGILAGTGFYMKVKILKRYGFNVKTLIEDMEYSMQIKEKIYFDDTVKVYDEKVINIRAMLKQILRWLRGGYQILFEKNNFHFKKLYIAIFPTLNLFYAITFPINILSIINISIIISILFNILYYSIIVYTDTFENIGIKDYFMFFFYNIIISIINVYALITFNNHKWERTQHLFN